MEAPDPADRLGVGQQAAQRALSNGNIHTGQELQSAVIGFATYAATLAPPELHQRLRVSSRTEFANEAAFLAALGDHFHAVARQYRLMEKDRA